MIIEVWQSGSEPTTIRSSTLAQQSSVKKDQGPKSKLRCLIKDEIIIIIIKAY